MPIYAYKCSECGHSVEVLQRLSDPPQVDCPQCGKPALVKQVTAAGFQLKGSGWYVTDFRDKAPAKKDEASAPSKAADAATPADKAGTKADTAAAPASDKSEKASPAPAPAPTPSPPAAGSGESS